MLAESYVRKSQLVIVGGDAAYGSKANMRMVQDRDTADPARRWGFVFAIARTWKTVEEKTLKNLVTHLPIPSPNSKKGQKQGLGEVSSH